MAEKRLLELVSHFPEHILWKAAQAYLFELGHAGDLEKARELFEKLRQIDENRDMLAEMAGFLVGRYVFRKDFDAAMTVYGFLAMENASLVFQLERINSANVLIHMLLPDQRERAFQVWNGFASSGPTQNQISQWAKLGIVLLKQAYRNSDSQIARQVFQILKQNLALGENQNLFREAEKLIGKFG